MDSSEIGSQGYGAEPLRWMLGLAQHFRYIIHSGYIRFFILQAQVSQCLLYPYQLFSSDLLLLSTPVVLGVARFKVSLDYRLQRLFAEVVIPTRIVCRHSELSTLKTIAPRRPSLMLSQNLADRNRTTAPGTLDHISRVIASLDKSVFALIAVGLIRSTFVILTVAPAFAEQASTSVRPERKDRDISLVPGSPETSLSISATLSVAFHITNQASPVRPPTAYLQSRRGK